MNAFSLALAMFMLFRVEAKSFVPEGLTKLYFHTRNCVGPATEVVQKHNLPNVRVDQNACLTVDVFHPYSKQHVFTLPRNAITPGFEYVCGELQNESFCYLYDVCYVAHSKREERIRRNREFARARVQIINGELVHSKYSIGDVTCQHPLSTVNLSAVATDLELIISQ
ncbi:hypothetical protein O9G_005048 [Rozella allomycis CSF55]|uniref:Uncharacterized protein n=1 Tax=Rozella allomycis (strain CSF55) TaxID=988480 RepID=A0A075AML5_ROZAC|nr:hypothetical protein O9G_005048 [Rozella allomycis CSF55]|eukprot:EPZ30881.1 hypothetical protein O9G_005048 [Rozella allomycis CSF55]